MIKVIFLNDEPPILQDRTSNTFEKYKKRIVSDPAPARIGVKIFLRSEPIPAGTRKVRRSKTNFLFDNPMLTPNIATTYLNIGSFYQANRTVCPLLMV